MVDESSNLEAKVAQAIYGEMARQAREELSAVYIDAAEIEEVFREALTQTDRGAAILVFSFVESLMHRVFSLHLDDTIRGGLASLFENNGPLSTASSRIRMLAALRWISRDVASGLDILRSIRNHFAHHISAKSFDDRKIASWIASLPQLEKRLEKVNAFAGIFSDKAKFTNRDRFLLRSTLIVSDLTVDAHVLPYSLKYHVHPAVVAADFDNQPENLKNASRAFSRVSLEVVKRFAPATIR